MRFLPCSSKRIVKASVGVEVALEMRSDSSKTASVGFLGELSRITHFISNGFLRRF